jgi:hypothetical protein
LKTNDGKRKSGVKAGRLHHPACRKYRGNKPAGRAAKEEQMIRARPSHIAANATVPGP